MVLQMHNLPSEAATGDGRFIFLGPIAEYDLKSRQS